MPDSALIGRRPWEPTFTLVLTGKPTEQKKTGIPRSRTTTSEGQPPILKVILQLHAIENINILDIIANNR